MTARRSTARSPPADGRAVLRGAIIHPLDRPADDEAAQSLARTGALQRAIAGDPIWRWACSRPRPPARMALRRCSWRWRIAAAFSRDAPLRSEPGEGWEFVGTLALDVLRQYLWAKR